MIFERRAYLLEPGRAVGFWEAQERWNTAEVFGPILDRNLFYAGHRSRRGTLIVHLYRLAGLDEWQTLYADYYRRQSPSYFQYVRPWMLAQENAFFAPAAFGELAGMLGAPERGLPASARGMDRDRAVLLETTIDLRPGGLPHLWNACAAGAGAIGIHQEHHLGSLTAVVGRQHRLVHYHVFGTNAEANAQARVIRAAMRTFDAAGWVVAERSLLLEPSPLRSRRSILEGRRR